MTEPTKPAADIKAAAQKDFDAKVAEELDAISAKVEELEDVDHDKVAALYRELLSMRDTVSSCPPAVRKRYNVIVQELFNHMDVIPTGMLLPDKDPRP